MDKSILNISIEDSGLLVEHLVMMTMMMLKMVVEMTVVEILENQKRLKLLIN